MGSAMNDFAQLLVVLQQGNSDQMGNATNYPAQLLVVSQQGTEPELSPRKLFKCKKHIVRK